METSSRNGLVISIKKKLNYEWQSFLFDTDLSIYVIKFRGMSFISEQGTLEKERKVVSTSMPELSKWMQSALKAILNLF